LIYYINASDGSVIKTEDPMRSCFDSNLIVKDKNNNNNNDNKAIYLPNNTTSSCAADCQTGTADLYYYGNQYIYTERFLHSLVNCTHRLKEVCTGTYVYVKNGLNDFRDASNNWTNSNDARGTTTFWSLSWANRFLATYLGRNSFDDNFHQIEASIGAGYTTQYNTTDKKITVGTTTGNTSGNWAGTLDIMGHELAHGVTDTECQLVNYGESGAIGEGISDIFGTMTEYWTARYKNLGRTPNYDYAEDISSTCGIRRSLSNPENYCCPNTYMAGPYWQDPSNTTNDNGGVHYNAGVLGKWFYLLAEGGNDINDLGNQYCIEGIGQDDASWILYEAMRN
jgi:Zn-dependent metalloprotease